MFNKTTQGTALVSTPALDTFAIVRTGSRTKDINRISILYPASNDSIRKFCNINELVHAVHVRPICPKCTSQHHPKLIQIISLPSKGDDGAVRICDAQFSLHPSLIRILLPKRRCTRSPESTTPHLSAERGIRVLIDRNIQLSNHQQYEVLQKLIESISSLQAVR